MSSSSSSLSLSSSSLNSIRPARVAIIGGGAAGLAAARALLRRWKIGSGRHENQPPSPPVPNASSSSNSFLCLDPSASGSTPRPLEVIILEKDDALGGIWRYVPGSTDRPMYRHLRTNLPKEIMAFREYPWPSSEEEALFGTADRDIITTASFVTHQQVLCYLQNYAARFQLIDHVHFRSTVQQLTILPVSPASPNGSVPGRSAFSPLEEDWPLIQLEWTELETDQLDSSVSSTQPPKSVSQVFDAVCVCNGHFGLPTSPMLPGLAQNFRGQVLHSIAYDHASPFTGQTVLCIGGRASGSDLARELSHVARQVYLSDSTKETGTPQTEFNVTWVPRTLEVLQDGRVRFDKDCPVTPQVDVIIFCTGYDYSFPFINAQSNMDLEAGRQRVQPLYEQLWHADYPNVAFLGLPHSIIPFPLFELQAQACSYLWLSAFQPTTPSGEQNVKQLLSRDERKQHAKLAAKSGGEGKTGGRVPEDTHYLGSAQWDYCRRMADYSAVYDTGLQNYLKVNQTIYEHSAATRSSDFPAGPDGYRSNKYERMDRKGSFRLRNANG